MGNRDKKGRFTPGNLANPKGRPPKPKEYTLKFDEALKEAMGDDNLRQILKTAISQARAGNRYARKFIMDYYAGVPEKVLQLQHDGQLNVSSGFERTLELLSDALTNDTKRNKE